MRCRSDLLQVGSLPADSTEHAFRAASELFGDMVFALPDGEPSPRAAWVGYEREQLVGADYPVAERGFEDLVARELERLLGEIPAVDLAIQWDFTGPARA